MSRIHTPPQLRQTMFGFTLIEMMITVAIIAILASIAYPSYQAHVRRSHRTSAQSFMMDVGTREQQRFLDVRSYADSVTAMGMAVPAEVAQRYTISIALTAGPPPGFTITALPIGSQTDDTCATLTLDQASVQTPTGCW